MKTPQSTRQFLGLSIDGPHSDNHPRTPSHEGHFRPIRPLLFLLIYGGSAIASIGILLLAIHLFH